MILCDGDCGNCYYYKDMNYTNHGQNLCDDCMFTYTAEQEAYERDEKPKY